MSVFLQLFDTRLKVQNFNNDFLILSSPTPNPTIGKIGTAIYQHQFDFVEEVIVTEVEICLKLNTKFQEAKIGLLTKITPQIIAESSIIELPVSFNDHPDWQAVQAFTGLSKSNIIQKLCAAEYTIAMFGFLPGFTYMTGLVSELHIPRKTIPAKYVPANSIAIGGKYLGIYAIDSPGGWHVVGQTPLSILQLPELPPVKFKVGDTVKLFSL